MDDEGISKAALVAAVNKLGSRVAEPAHLIWMRHSSTMNALSSLASSSRLTTTPLQAPRVGL